MNPVTESAMIEDRPVMSSSNEVRRDSDRERLSQIADDVYAEIQQTLRTQRLPTATYRVQLNSDCTFRDVEGIVPYLFTLGISDLYASPFLQARPGSRHGYDVVNHAALNSEIGTQEDLTSLRSALREHDMGLLADVVPNHMAASPLLNSWWQDVLENGPSSTFASFFDIDWMPLKPDLAHKVLLPVLGDQFGKVLEDGQLVVRYGDGSFWLEYFSQRFPLAPRSYSLILAQHLDDLRQQNGEDPADMQEFLSILTAIKNLPDRLETQADRLAERRREKEVIKRRLNDLIQKSPRIAEFVHENVRQINGCPGQPESFDRLDELLQEQAYRLAFWSVASDEINYRRFFDINELAAICTESPQVFDETHRYLFELLDQGTITGLRIDHPDGLYDPRGYLHALQERRFLQLCHQKLMSTPSGHMFAENGDKQEAEQRLLELWRADRDQRDAALPLPLFVVIEKILAHNETLPDDWPVHGTVGYDFLNAVNGVFVDVRGERPLTAFCARFTKASVDFEELAYQGKRLIVRMSMASELNVLGHRLDRISERNRWTRDFTLYSLTRALMEVIACFRIYRSYVQPGRVLERDRRYVEEAVALAKRRNPAMDASIFVFVRDVLLLRFRENADDQERDDIVRFAGKFQQLTGPIMAKAVEDTIFYRFNRLVSLNEVGGEPARFGTSVEMLHRLNAARLPRMSSSLNATSTHDTKRSEDVRARINVLSEIPKEWQERVQKWHRWNRELKQHIDGIESPSRNAEYLLYQTLVGTWPNEIPSGQAAATYVTRLQQYMQKVVREAKVHTSWISPNEAYETSIANFVSGVLDQGRRSAFLNSLHDFATKVADHGRWNSLSQLVLKMTSPGIPDFYQGTESWNLTLVDPDNRQPVDFAAHRDRLDDLLADMASALGQSTPAQAIETWLDQQAALEAGVADHVRTFVARLLDERCDGLIKLFVTMIGLRIRRQCPALFSCGAYEPLSVTGSGADHLMAYSRRHGPQTLMVVVPRLTASLCGFGGGPPIGEIWGDTQIQLSPECAKPSLKNVLTRSRVECEETAHTLAIRDVLRQLPLAILLNAGP